MSGIPVQDEFNPMGDYFLIRGKYIDVEGVRLDKVINQVKDDISKIKTDSYTKQQADDKFAAKTDVYTKPEVDTALNGKVSVQSGYGLISDAEKAQIQTNKANITAAETAISGKASQEEVNTIKSDVAGKASAEAVTQLQTEMDVQKARMDQLVGTVPEGSADEIADARVTADGKTEANLGNAIRSQVSGLKETIAEIQTYNIFDENKAEGGYIAYANGEIAPSGSYLTSDFLPIKAGESIVISPRARKLLAYYDNKYPIAESFVDIRSTEPYTFTATVDGYVRATLFKADKHKQIAYGTDVKPYIAYTSNVLYDHESRLVSLENTEPVSEDAVKKVADEVKSLEKSLDYIYTGVPKSGDVLFTIDDVSKGTEISYDFNATGEAGYIDFVDADNNRITYIGKGSSAITITDFNGKYVIPDNFAKCRASGYIAIKHITKGKSVTERLNDLSTKSNGVVREEVVNNTLINIDSSILSMKITGEYKRDNVPLDPTDLRGTSGYDKMIVLDGSEVWTTGSGLFVLDLSDIDTASGYVVAAADRYKGVLWGNILAKNKQISQINSTLRIRDTDYATIDEFKASLVANPLIVWYRSTNFKNSVMRYYIAYTEKNGIIKTIGNVNAMRFLYNGDTIDFMTGVVERDGVSEPNKVIFNTSFKDMNGEVKISSDCGVLIKYTQNISDVGKMIDYPLTTMPEYIVKNLAYKPLGVLSKPYICLTCDDGEARLATYTIPMLLSKNVPCTFALYEHSDVLDNPEYLAILRQAINAGCEVAQHGMYYWASYGDEHTRYSEKTLNEFFDHEQNYFDRIGIPVHGAIAPYGYVDDMVKAMAGGRYGVNRALYQHGDNRYDYYASGPRSNIYALTATNVKAHTLEYYKAAIDYTIANNYLLVLYFHDWDLTDEQKAVLEGLIDYAKSTEINWCHLGDIPDLA